MRIKQFLPVPKKNKNWHKQLAKTSPLATKYASLYNRKNVLHGVPTYPEIKNHI